MNKNNLRILCFSLLLAVHLGESRITSTRTDNYFSEEEMLTAEELKSVISIMKKLREDAIEDKNDLVKLILKIQNDTEILNKNIAEIKNKLIPKEEKVSSSTLDGEISRDGTQDIWEAAAKSLPAVKFYYKADPTCVNRKNKKDFNRTPLYYASLNGHVDIVQFLLAKGADVNAINSLGSSPLMAAAKKQRNLVVIKHLLDHGADINQSDRDRETAIYYAISINDLDAVKLLIKRGADRYIKNTSRKTPLDYAKGLKKTSIVNYLSSL